MNNSNPIFILGCHKSGTSLLRSLFDGHPEVIVFPKETHFFQYGGYGTIYPLRKAWPDGENKNIFIESLVKGVISENYGDDPYSDNPGFKGYNIDRFRETLLQLPLETPSQRIESYFKSLYKSMTGLNLPEDKRILEKSVESAEHVPWLRMIYPKCQFIHIVRNPYATLTSLVLSKKRSGRYPLMRPLIESLYHSTFHLFQNRQLVDEYMVVRYEDLISDPKEFMKKIALFLNINYDSILLEPTINGIPWTGNSSTNVKFDGIINTTSEKWMSEINSVEINLVNQYLKPLLAEYEYKQLNVKRKAIWPVKGEGVKTYLRNRALIYL